MSRRTDQVADATTKLLRKRKKADRITDDDDATITKPPKKQTNTRKEATDEEDKVPGLTTKSAKKGKGRAQPAHVNKKPKCSINKIEIIVA